MFKIAWEDADDLKKGHKYLYLTTEDYAKITHLNVVRVELLEEAGEQR